MDDLRKLAEFIHDLTWEKLPDEVKQAAPSRVLDLVSVAVGAAGDGLIDSMAKDLSRRYPGGGVSVWGRRETYPLTAAAMLNAMMAHTLELDDVHSASKTHGSASIIPAAWTAARYLGRSGKEFLTAVVCGYETACRIGMALGVSSHRSRGWHATSTCGVFGCAAACARLLNLNTEQILSALGMAGTQSCGLWAFLGDGSSCKILHPARAAANGIDAAFFAQAGMTGPEHILDAEDGGLLRAMSDDYEAGLVSKGLGTVYELLNMDVKPYPCCRSAHCVIDGILEIRKNFTDGRPGAEAVEKIEVMTYDVGYKQCAVSEGCLHPGNPLEARFSIPYAAAVALLFGRVTLAEYEQKVIASLEVRQVVEKVTVLPDSRFTGQYPRHWGCEVIITDKANRRFSAVIEDASGSVSRPLSKEQMIDKAMGFLIPVFQSGAEQVADRLLGLEEERELPDLIK